MQKIVAGLFSGVGGIELGFEQAGFKLSWSNEMDKFACQTFRRNFDHLLIEDNIDNILDSTSPYYSTISQSPIDILVGGFPCQAFSIAGERLGFSDSRGNLFFSIIHFLQIRKTNDNLPSCLFLENVRNLASHDNGRTLTIILGELEKLGYHITYKVLNSYEYSSTLQIRERIYIVAFLDQKAFHKFSWIEPLLNKQKQREDFLERKVDSQFYYTKEKYPRYFGDNFDLASEINDKNSFYQIRRGQYIRKTSDGKCPTLTANMGTGGHNVSLVKDDAGIRKLTPRECFNLQGYPSSFTFPSLGNSHLYKQAGNSVVVPMVKKIAENILKALN